MFDGVLRERARGEVAGLPGADIAWSVGELFAIELEHPADRALRELDEAQLAFQRVEAARVVALLNAWDAGMADLAERYGADARDRDGLPARAVMKQVGMILRIPESTTAHLLDTAMVLRDSFPITWKAFTSGRTTWRAVDILVKQSIGLDEDALADFDRLAADMVVTGTPGRLADRLRRARERLQPGTAVARAAVTEANRRVEFDPLPDGEAALTIRGPAVELVAINDALTRAAVAVRGRDGEKRGIGALRFDIALDLLLGGIAHAAHPDCSAIAGRVPQRTAVVPTVAMTIPALAWLGHTSEQAILAGYGPIDIETARRLCADAPSLLRVLTDPVTGVRVTMDQTVYTPPPDLKRWLRIRDEQCAGLGCRRPAHLCDIDHVTEWHAGGTTDAGNLVHLCRRCHLLKSTGMWTQRLDPGGTVTWTSPWGRSYTGDPPERSDPAPPEFLPEHGDSADDSADDCPF
ncbi:DUF222 domain-containing protein [uncultured Amnibacterium sp.]|uniref:HNH endonuclease signature motif containing protein n=1 Tax=uncultured Amnibacterium sp. TaxID=1631851 RepID=UPI0035CB31BA